jgi:hypothetical protein
MNWLPWPVLPKKRWPAIKFKEKRAITQTEHQAIVQREQKSRTQSVLSTRMAFGCFTIGYARKAKVELPSLGDYER